jgi:hypothetical protein
MRNKIKYQSTRLSRWLLPVFIFFSSLSFSGFIADRPSAQQEENLTAPLYAANFKAGKRSVSYKKAISFCYRERVLVNAIKNKKNALSYQRRIIKIKIAENLFQSLSFTSVECFVHVKTIPRGSNEDLIYSSLAG